MTAGKRRNHGVSSYLTIMGLTGLDSNRLDGLLRFKGTLPLPLTDKRDELDSGREVISKVAIGKADIGKAARPSGETIPAAREVNEYGETEAKRPVQKQTRLNAEEIKLLIAGYESGISTYALARQFGCHRTTVSELLKKHGVNVSKSSAQKRLDADDVVTMYKDMRSTAEIAEKYSVGQNTVVRCLRAQGVKIRGRWG